MFLQCHAISQLLTQPGLVLTDIRLPKMEGLTACSEIHKLGERQTEALRHKVRDFLSAEGVLNSDAAERFRDLS